MKLPGADEAIIDIAKLRDYCLDPNHPRGKHKARVFKRALGLTKDDTDELKETIKSEIQINDCEEREFDSYGRRYVVDFEVEREGRTAQIRTSWIIKRDEEFPRWTSCFVRS